MQISVELLMKTFEMEISLLIAQETCNYSEFILLVEFLWFLDLIFPLEPNPFYEF